MSPETTKDDFVRRLNNAPVDEWPPIIARFVDSRIAAMAKVPILQQEIRYRLDEVYPKDAPGSHDKLADLLFELQDVACTSKPAEPAPVETCGVESPGTAYTCKLVKGHTGDHMGDWGRKWPALITNYCDATHGEHICRLVKGHEGQHREGICVWDEPARDIGKEIAQKVVVYRSGRTLIEIGTEEPTEILTWEIDATRLIALIGNLCIAAARKEWEVEHKAECDNLRSIRESEFASGKAAAVKAVRAAAPYAKCDVDAFVVRLADVIKAIEEAKP